MSIKINYKSFSTIFILFLTILLLVHGSDKSLTAQGNQQVNHARELEGLNTVNMINRAQQAYHFEKISFTTNIRNLGISNGEMLISPNYSFKIISNGEMLISPNYNFKIIQADLHKAIVIGRAKRNGLRSFAGLVQFNADKTYEVITCRTNSPSYSISLPIDGNTCGLGSSRFPSF